VLKISSHIIGLLIFLSSLAAASSHDELCVDLLPSEAQTVLENQFPRLYPEKVSDLSAEYRKAWLKDHPQDCPGIAVGHFQSPTKTSYAVLLIGSKGGLSGSKLVLLNQGASGAWKATKIAEEEMSYYYEAVSKLPGSKGRHTGALDRIQLKQFDAGSTVYYWRGGRFHGIAMKD
jgi:hypothetical protein